MSEQNQPSSTNLKTNPPGNALLGARDARILSISNQARADGRNLLLEHESKAILDHVGITITKCHLAPTITDAVTLSQRLGFPVALKVASPDVIHKSDSGGVHLSLKNTDEVQQAFRQIETTFVQHNVLGATVQPMVTPGLEAILGLTRDPQFGPMLMFGLGGIFVEILHDVTFRVLPLSPDDPSKMIREIQGYPLLRGFRGHIADDQALYDLCLILSQLIETYPEIQELDLNPVFVYSSGYCVVDARIVCGPANESHDLTFSQVPFIESDLSNLFYPKSIAIVGATNSPEKLGYTVLKNLICHDFAGKLYPVNPRDLTIQGLPTYASVLDLPESPDLAIIIVPAQATLQAVVECCQKGIRFLVLESAGFAETGSQGQQVQNELLTTIRNYQTRILGPNCTGIINTHHNMVQTIGPLGNLGKGNVGLIAQAGVYAAGILVGLRQIIDFGIIATIGNKMDINEVDILKFLAQDPHIEVIALYLEDMRHGRQFFQTARQVTSHKPVIVLKSGRTTAGQKVAASHTASLAGQDRINNAVFRQSGIIRARDNEHMFHLIRAFSKQPLPRNNGVYIITYTGSFGVSAVDSLDSHGMQLSQLEPERCQQIQNLVPEYIDTINPLDFAFTMNAQQLEKALHICMHSPTVGSCLVILQGEILDTYLDLFRSISYPKPVLCCVACKEFMMDSVITLENLGYPVFSTPEMATEVLATMYRYASSSR
jgi:acyl-CoA synthetase (NDP forming)